MNSSGNRPNPVFRFFSNLFGKSDKRESETQSEKSVSADPGREMPDASAYKNTTADTTDQQPVNPIFSIQQLLYEHPLYETMPFDAAEINILVIGDGKQAEEFTDIALQAGQMDNTVLHIDHIVKDDIAARDRYLAPRPAMQEFIDIKGVPFLAKQPAYAHLSFRSLSEIAAETDSSSQPVWFDSEASAQNLTLQITDAAIEEGTEYHYVFVCATDDDAVNHAIAACISKELSVPDSPVPVAYAVNCHSHENLAEARQKIYQIASADSAVPQDTDSPLNRMAFNTHLSWKSDLNFDVLEEKQNFFSDAYNFRSSLSFALSLKYKLHTIGIDTDDPQEAADLFSELVLDAREESKEASALFGRMAALEHRRWLLGMAADGWHAPRNADGTLDLDSCIRNHSVKNPAEKTHPCMVPGTAAFPLKSFTKQKWDSGNIDPSLDPLDRMSVELHRKFSKIAKAIRRGNPLEGNALTEIRIRIPSDYTEASRALDRFEFALQNILNGEKSYSLQYNVYRGDLTDTLSSLPADHQEQIKTRLEELDDLFFPVIESTLYRDYKANDHVLIEKIPFILTYQYPSVLALSFEDGRNDDRNDAIFSNVASATVLNPQCIHYLYCMDQDSRPHLLIRKLDSVLRYLEKRNVRCDVHLAIAALPEVSDDKKASLDIALDEICKKSRSGGNARLASYCIQEDTSDSDAAVSWLIAYLKNACVDLYDIRTAPFRSPLKNAVLISQIAESDIPYFEFSSRAREFTTHSGCDYLKYVHDKSYLRAEDMFALMNVEAAAYHLPEFEKEYSSLWSIYTGSYRNSDYSSGIRTWNKLCEILSYYDENLSPLASFEISHTYTAAVSETWHLKKESYLTARYLMEQLTAYGITGKDSTITLPEEGAFDLTLTFCDDYTAQINKIFSSEDNLNRNSGLEIHEKKPSNGCRIIHITTADLQVCNLDLRWDGKKEISSNAVRSLKELLKNLAQHRFIQNYRVDRNNGSVISFNYTAPRFKKLLTKAGDLLEIYAYYEIMKTGYFDDVLTGYEFFWEDGTVKNELDLVLTKGFRSIIVECKGTYKLKQDYYYKLRTLSDHFGIGTIPVLLGTAYSNDYKDVSEMQISRGNQMNIVTITDEEDVRNVGQKLVTLMESSL